MPQVETMHTGSISANAFIVSFRPSERDDVGTYRIHSCDEPLTAILRMPRNRELVDALDAAMQSTDGFHIAVRVPIMLGKLNTAHGFYNCWLMAPPTGERTLYAADMIVPFVERVGALGSGTIVQTKYAPAAQYFVPPKSKLNHIINSEPKFGVHGIVQSVPQSIESRIVVDAHKRIPSDAMEVFNRCAVRDLASQQTVWWAMSSEITEELLDYRKLKGLAPSYR